MCIVCSLPNLTICTTLKKKNRVLFKIFKTDWFESWYNLIFLNKHSFKIICINFRQMKIVVVGRWQILVNNYNNKIQSQILF